VHDEHLRVAIDDTVVDLPLGMRTLLASILADPPGPEELTNAIGNVTDHLDDLLRLHPAAANATVTLAGDAIAALAYTEFGGRTALPHLVDRADLEDVFRTVATERRVDRRHNPGLDPADIDAVVVAGCVAVAVARHFALDTLLLDELRDGDRP
jgi:exopolyphosphatase / guanosine-5'-triphosphate,3'-diphosphate pyrophosphatase